MLDLDQIACNEIHEIYAPMENQTVVMLVVSFCNDVIYKCNKIMKYEKQKMTNEQ